MGTLPPEDHFAELVAIMARLRAPGGCPWDREQTFQTIKPFLLQETYEVLDAIDREDFSELASELGDLLLQAVFFSQMASEAGHFTISDALQAINQKLIRRHPHIFGTETAATEADVRRRWNEIKASEKDTPIAVLDSVPRSLPALVEAEQISSRAAARGFDWQSPIDILDKLDEERAELAQAHTPAEVEEELGDILFTVVNLARHLKVDPEQALRRTNAKFRRRFGHVERELTAHGKRLEDASLEEMEALWQTAKEQ
ncbi:MAG: nucleoside triphosphate pyrophosphohydrolase [Acidobacteriota bacterium]|nr:nucleoside triphosphate pyrophosphohydrolase [Acidobacteriota bacterium]